MGFADNYLQKHALGQPLVESAPDPHLHCIIAIPAYNESGLTTCLDSLFLCDTPGRHSEVIVLINSGEHTSRGIIEQNRKTKTEVLDWCQTHHREELDFHVVLVENLPWKHFGAGLARKLVMDEAIRRFNQINHPEGIIFSLDADTTVEANYLQEVSRLFDTSLKTEGCSIRFEHPLDAPDHPADRISGYSKESIDDSDRIFNDDSSELLKDHSGELLNEHSQAKSNDHSDAIFDAIVQYELHQRYYLEAVRYAGYPYAYHTVGSAFAVRASAYCSQGGMSKRQAGEDFYFIQKLAEQGHYAECNNTVVHPSPRPSDRVPFGTGPAVSRQLEHPGKPYLTYEPELFEHLELFYSCLPEWYSSADPQKTIQKLHPGLRDYLAETNFSSSLGEIRQNVASEKTFQKRFYRKFNMFWILKYLHYAEEHGTVQREVGYAAGKMLQMRSNEDVPTSQAAWPTPGGTTQAGKVLLRELLLQYRKIQARWKSPDS